MIPAVRSQADDLGDEYSDAGAIDTGTEMLTRQEFKDEADLNILLARFGVNTPIRQGAIYGQEIDYNLDLQQAFAAIEAARRANLQVPEELREKYPTWREVLNGAETGEYSKDLQELADKQTSAREESKRMQDYQTEKAAMQRRQKVERDLKREREDSAPEVTPKD